MTLGTLIGVYSLLASVSIAGASGTTGPVTGVFYIDPNSVPLTTRSAWCRSELDVCAELCGGAASDNSCNTSTLSFACKCSDGTSPELNLYTGTIPYYACMAAFTNCIAEHAGDVAGQQNCATSIRDQCGELDASSVASTTTTTSTSKSSTKIGAANTTAPTSTEATTTSTPTTDGVTNGVTSTKVESSQGTIVTVTSADSLSTRTTTVVPGGSSTASSLSTSAVTSSSQVSSTGTSPSATSPASSGGLIIGTQGGRRLSAGFGALLLLSWLL